MERFLQPMSEGRASHACPSQWETSVPKLLWSLFRGRASEMPRQTPRDALSNQEADHLRGSPASQMECLPLVQSGGEFPRGRGKDRGRTLDSRGRTGEEKVHPVVKKGKKEKEKKPRRLLAFSSCLLAFSSTRGCSSRLVRSRAGWRPLRRSWSLVLGAALWRRVRVPPPDKLDQTARGGQVQE